MLGKKYTIGKNTKLVSMCFYFFFFFFFFAYLADLNIKACVDFYWLCSFFLHARIGFTKNPDIKHTIYFEWPKGFLHH